MFKAGRPSQPSRFSLPIVAPQLAQRLVETKSASTWPPPTPLHARLTRRIQRLDSRTIALLVRMVVTLGHRHRLVAGEVVDLLDGDAEVQ